MVRASTVVILLGIALLLIPIPPIATVSGIVVILIGLAMRFIFDV